MGNIYPLLIGIILSSSITLYADDQGVKVMTPYGEMIFTDDDDSSLILNEYAKTSDNYQTDSLNTRAIISVCEKADGALSEIMDYICLDDFVNKPEIIADIYDSDCKSLEKYIDYIGLFRK